MSLVNYVIDLETNGLKLGYHSINEIGIIRCADRMQLCRDVRCLTPERSSYDALKITGKTLADLANGDTEEEVVDKCNRFFDQDGLTPAHRCIIGHNIITFDQRFLFHLWESVGKEFPAHLWLDTIHLTKQFIKNAGIDKDCKEKGIKKPKVNLHASCDLVGIKKISTAHSAKSDTRNTYLLWRDLIDNKEVDYLPHIKTAIHYINPPNPDDECGLDPALLDND